jgi:hypothetical protein
MVIVLYGPLYFSFPLLSPGQAKVFSSTLMLAPSTPPVHHQRKYFVQAPSAVSPVQVPVAVPPTVDACAIPAKPKDSTAAANSRFMTFTHIETSHIGAHKAPRPSIHVEFMQRNG